VEHRATSCLHSGTVASSISRVTPVLTHRIQIFFQRILPCHHWSSSPPSATFWDPFQSQTTNNNNKFEYAITMSYIYLAQSVRLLQWVIYNIVERISIKVNRLQITNMITTEIFSVFERNDFAPSSQELSRRSLKSGA